MCDCTYGEHRVVEPSRFDKNLREPFTFRTDRADLPTKVVIAEDMIYTDRSFQYAAAWRRIHVPAGEYPVELVTIGWSEPFHHQGPDQTSGQPYYVRAVVPVTTIDGQHVPDVDSHVFWRYSYEAVIGRVMDAGNSIDGDTRVAVTFA